MFRSKKTALTISFLLTISTHALHAEPVYDCTASETKQYIEQVSYNVFTPSTLSSPEEFQDAFIKREELAAAAGDASSKACLTIFSDGELLDDWKAAIDAIRNFNLDISFTSIDGAALKAMLDQAKKMAQEELMKALEELGGDICKFMSTDNLKKILLSNVNKQFGISARNLRVADYAAIVKRDALRNASDNVQYLLSPEDLVDDFGDASRQELKKQRKELWNKF